MRPYTPETLAERRGCSANTVRNKCNEGELAHFRLGRLYRIPAKVVEEIEECQTFQSDDCAGGSALVGDPKASESAISLRHAPERKRRQKP